MGRCTFPQTATRSWNRFCTHGKSSRKQVTASLQIRRRLNKGPPLNDTFQSADSVRGCHVLLSLAPSACLCLHIVRSHIVVIFCQQFLAISQISLSSKSLLPVSIKPDILQGRPILLRWMCPEPKSVKILEKSEICLVFLCTIIETIVWEELRADFSLRQSPLSL